MMKTIEPNTPNSAPAKMRYPHLVRFVRHEDVEGYEKQGWEWTSALVDTHHGEHAVLMIWPHDTEPTDGN